MSSLTVVNGSKSVVVKATPNTQLMAVVEEACRKLKFDPNHHGLQFGRKELDLSIPLRYANLPAGAKLELVPRTCSADAGIVRVGLQLSTGEQLSCQSPCAASVFELLRSCQTADTPFLVRGSPGQWLQPTVRYMNHEVATFDALRSTTLAQLGVSANSAIRMHVAFNPVDSVPDWVLEAVNGTSLASTATASSVPTDSNKADAKNAVKEAKVGVAESNARSIEDSLPSTSTPSAPSNPTAGSTAAVQQQPPAQSAQEAAQALATVADVGRAVHVYSRQALQQQSAALGSSTEPPDEFFEFTQADYARENAARQALARKQESGLRTRQMREQEELLRARRFSETTVRVHFPDHVYLEAHFAPLEPLSALYDLVTKCLTDPKRPFYLYTTPPKTKLTDTHKTFYACGLVPAAIVYFAYTSGAQEGPFLKESIASLVDKLKPEAPHAEANAAAESESRPLATNGLGAGPSAVTPAVDSAAAEQEAEPRARPVVSSSKPKWFKK
eukprot:jgi/Chlat1/8713/Chrsp89S08086